MGIEARFEEWRKKNPLRFWREQQEPSVTKATVCAVAGVTLNTVTKWEQGSAMPSDENMESLAELMGRDASELKSEWHNWMQAAGTVAGK